MSYEFLKSFLKQLLWIKIKFLNVHASINKNKVWLKTMSDDAG